MIGPSLGGAFAIGGSFVRERVRGAADRIIAKSPLQAWYRWSGAERVAVLAYHAVHDADRFESQMRYLLRRMRPMSVSDFARAVRSRTASESRSVLITFDDGDRTVLDIAMPILRHLGVPAVAFPIVDRIDTDRPFWWDEMAELVRIVGGVPGWGKMEAATAIGRAKRVTDGDRRRVLEELRRTAGRAASPVRQLRREDLATLESNGIEIGNHTLSHPCLPRCDDATVVTEIEAADDRLTAILGHAPVAFCYPNGDWDARAEDVLDRLGYGFAFLFDHRLCDPRTVDPRRVPRVRTDASASIDRFAILTSGLHPALHHLRGRR
jgi:peptidoglycan/xylan/chitin deacetylase (PgdA/CDA1 family)